MYTCIVLSTDCGLRGINPESFDQNNPKERFPPNKLSSFTKANSSVAHAKIKKKMITEKGRRESLRSHSSLATSSRYRPCLPIALCAMKKKEKSVEEAVTKEY